MEHQFDIDVAKIVGVNAAVIYQNIKFWCLKNKANNVHFHDGNYWTYNSKTSFSQLFPYLTESQIKTALNKLIDNGFIGVGKYNINPYDHTHWYSDLKTTDWIKIANRSDENIQALDKNRQCITDSKHTDINTDNKLTDNSFTAGAEEKKSGDIFSNEDPIEPTGKEKSSAKKESEKFGKAEFRQTLLDIGVKKQYVDDWMAVRTAKRAVFTATALQAIFNECIAHNLPVADAIKMCAEKSWQGFKYSWYLKEINDGKQTSNTTSQSREQRVNEVAEFRVANQQSLATRLQKYITSDNE